MKKELKTKDAVRKPGKKDSPRRIDANTWTFRGHEIVRDAGYIIFDKAGYVVKALDDYFEAVAHIKGRAARAAA